MGTDNSVDVVIITALLKEQQAVLKHLETVNQTVTKNRIIYRSKIPHENGQGTYSVVVFSLPGMGNIQASIATTQAITIWNPSQIILTELGRIKRNQINI